MDAATYRRARAEGIPAKSALSLARWITEPKLDIEPGGLPLRLQRDGFDLTIAVAPDEGISFADLNYGTFEDGIEDWRTGYWHAESPDAIPNPNRDSRAPGNGARFYVPAEPLAARVKEYRRMGYSKSAALDAARESVEDEAKRVTWDYGPAVYVLTVTASRGGIELGSASVGGIEIAWSDITRTDGSEYFSEVAEDIIPEAIDDAREALARLAVSA